MFRTLCFLIFATLAGPAMASSVLWDEAVDGDISGDPWTSIGIGAAGTYTVTGSSRLDLEFVVSDVDALRVTLADTLFVSAINVLALDPSGTTRALGGTLGAVFRVFDRRDPANVVFRAEVSDGQPVLTVTPYVPSLDQAYLFRVGPTCTGRCGRWGNTVSYTYSITVSEIPASVPLPATVVFLFSTIGGLAALRRWRMTSPVALG